MIFILEDEDVIKHYGTPRHSGRYPWGSGGNAQAKRSRDFLDIVEKMRKQDGLSYAEIAKGMGMSTTQLLAYKSIAVNERDQALVNQALRLQDKGLSNSAIGRQMGINESTVRSLTAPGRQDKMDVLQNTANTLKKEVDEKGMIQVGSGVENRMDIARTKLDTALAMVEAQGYNIHTIQVPQLGTDKLTTVKVLAQPHISKNDVYKNRGDIKLIDSFSEDGGRTSLGLYPPMSIDSKRIAVKYAEDGGAKEDGVVYIRPNVKDISIGSNRYAQVRIAVDGTHYIKGMAMYKDDLPDGVDLVFNTNKSKTSDDIKDVLKPMKVNETTGKVDTQNPFGAQIKRQLLEGEKGKEKLTSAMNIVYEEGDWDTWSRSLSSQILSKQDPKLVKGQLDMTYERKLDAYDEIRHLTNPTVKKYLLEKFADGADSSSVHLKAAVLPGTSYHVILPITSMKPNEVYAPNFRDGQRVALIRSPHGGTFEIPELTVNNRNRQAARLIGKGAKDAVGIHHSVAERLSGADFDGDNVLVVPNDRGHIKSTPALKDLEGFDTKRAFPGYPGMKTMGDREQLEMGLITNLIADMTLQGATQSELARAVRHSMVVIDAEKHGLDYKGSYKQNSISDLKEKYQGSKRGGAATLITRAKSDEIVPHRKLRRASKGGPIDPETGKKVYEPTGRMYRDREGNLVPRTTRSTKLAEVDDATRLISKTGTQVEYIYADHSNKLKALANDARKEILTTHDIPYSPSAKAAYSNEVASLQAKLNRAKKNRPLEKQAQIIGNAVYSQALQQNPNMDKATKKKIKNQALNEARLRTGATKHRIDLTQGEWDAIQAGAISKKDVMDILQNSDIDRVRELATPKTLIKMTPAKVVRAEQMERLGFTQAEIANQLGVSLTTVKTHLNPKDDDDDD